jgi:hypothetical protein
VKALKKEPAEGSDVALIHGKTADGEGLRIIRRRDDRIELGAVRPLKEGAPIAGEIVSLTPRSDFPLLCDVKVQYSAPPVRNDVAESPRHGPAQVATDRYRENWDRIWMSKSKAELSN